MVRPGQGKGLPLAVDTSTGKAPAQGVERRLDGSGGEPRGLVRDDVELLRQGNLLEALAISPGAAPKGHRQDVVTDEMPPFADREHLGVSRVSPQAPKFLGRDDPFAGKERFRRRTEVP